jgi:chromatin modification-related protein VID21
MRVDFREERRWKIALAYNLSTAVLEWHFAKTPEERQRAGICVKWKPHTEKPVDEDPTIMDIDNSPPYNASLGNPNMELLGVNYGSDEEDEEELEKEQHTVIDALEPAAVIEDALNDNIKVQPKNEDVDDRSALHLLHRTPDLGDQQSSSPVANASAPATDNCSGLKSNSSDPVLCDPKSSSQSTNGDADLPVSEAKFSKATLAPVRERLAYTGDDQLFVDLDNAPGFDTVDLNTLFPDLQPYGLLDVPVVGALSEGKKKVEKRSDRDDPNKRIEDTTYTRLYPTGRFMYNKPTLIGPLHPAKQWKDGKWLPMGQTAVLPAEVDSSARVMEDSTSGEIS